jgi:hypothetical protein
MSLSQLKEELYKKDLRKFRTASGLVRKENGDVDFANFIGTNHKSMGHVLTYLESLSPEDARKCILPLIVHRNGEGKRAREVHRICVGIASYIALKNHDPELTATLAKHPDEKVCQSYREMEKMALGEVAGNIDYFVKRFNPVLKAKSANDECLTLERSGNGNGHPEHSSSLRCRGINMTFGYNPNGSEALGEATLDLYIFIPVSFAISVATENPNIAVGGSIASIGKFYLDCYRAGKHEKGLIGTGADLVKYAFKRLYL